MNAGELIQLKTLDSPNSKIQIVTEADGYMKLINTDGQTSVEIISFFPSEIIAEAGKGKPLILIETAQGVVPAIPVPLIGFVVIPLLARDFLPLFDKAAKKEEANPHKPEGRAGIRLDKTPALT